MSCSQPLSQDPFLPQSRMWPRISLLRAKTHSTLTLRLCTGLRVRRGVDCVLAMPVPLATTNPAGLGLKVAHAAELQTEGPFARFKAQEADGAGASAAKVAEGAAASGAAANAPSPLDAATPAVVTTNLNFWYPDIGEAGPQAHPSGKPQPARRQGDGERPSVCPHPPLPQTGSRCPTPRPWCKT